MIIESVIPYLGGKHGVEMCLLDAPETSDLIIPGEPFPLSKLTASKVEEIMARKGDQEVWIIRTSHPGDWFGMIDLLPSRLCTSGYVQPEIDRIMKELSDDFTTLCAQAEGWGDYSLDDITVTVKPCLEGEHGTVTEHANHAGIFFADRKVENGCGKGHDLIESFIFDGEWKHRFGDHPINQQHFLDAAHKVRERVRATGLFSDTDTLQIEFMVSGAGTAVTCFQVRKIANQLILPGTPSRQGYSQMVGTTDVIGGLVKNVDPSYIDENIKSGGPVIFNTELKQTPWFVPNENFKGVATLGNPSFTHGKVRVAHLALLNQGYAGFRNGPHELRKKGTAKRVLLRDFHDQHVQLQWDEEVGEVVMLAE